MCKVLEMDYEIIRTLDPYRLVINNSYFTDSWETWSIKYQIFESEQNPIDIEDTIRGYSQTTYVDKILPFIDHLDPQWDFYVGHPCQINKFIGRDRL